MDTTETPRPIPVSAPDTPGASPGDTSEPRFVSTPGSSVFGVVNAAGERIGPARERHHPGTA